MSSRLIEPQRSQALRQASHCAVCGVALRGVYFYLPDRADCYCEPCMTTRPRCAGCGAPVGDTG